MINKRTKKHIHLPEQDFFGDLNETYNKKASSSRYEVQGSTGVKI
jgi:hypothetical protein